MELAQQTRPSLWFALLWKDFQQVKSTFIAVLAGVFVVQLLLLFSAGFAPNDESRMALFGGTVTFACIAPILLALGCGGMLIGQERQSGTWAWSSSLPASPTKGSPCASSLSPGASPTISQSARGANAGSVLGWPTPKTVFLRPSHRAQAWQVLTALCSCCQSIWAMPCGTGCKATDDAAPSAVLRAGVGVGVAAGARSAGAA